MKQGTETKTLPQRSRIRQFPFSGIIAAVVLVVLIIIPFVVKSPYFVHIFIMIFLFGYLATAWGLVGQSGQLSFGHAAFFGLGAYSSTILYMETGLSPWLGMLVGAIVAVIAGAIIGYPTLRLRGVYFALATLAFCAILQMYARATQFIGPFTLGSAFGLWISPFSGAEGPLYFQFASKTPFYFIALGMLVGAVSVSYLLNRSRIGYYWTAMRSDPDAAESLGINVGRYRLRTLLISCALTAIGGSFYSQYYYYITPSQVLDLGLSLKIVVVGIIGGWQSVLGPLIGGFIIIPIDEVLRTQFGSSVPGLHLIIYGIVLMLIILFVPKGVNDWVMRGLRWIDTKHWRPSENANDKLERQ